MRFLKAALFALSTLAPGALAAAETLDIDTTYGDAGGCAFVASGVTSTDDLLILRPNEIQRYESRCEFLDVRKSSLGPSVVRSLCIGEGMYWLNDLIVSESREEENALVVHFGTDRPEVTVRPCE